MGDLLSQWITALKREVLTYHEQYRHPRLPPPDVSYCYSLGEPFLSQEQNPRKKWPAKWPNSDLPGVYAFFNANEELIYIGKAAHLGARLSSYFRFGKDQSCEPTGNWGLHGSPAILVSIALSEPFEAPGLEEYLIGKLSPPSNKVATSTHLREQ